MGKKDKLEKSIGVRGPGKSGKAEASDEELEALIKAGKAGAQDNADAAGDASVPDDSDKSTRPGVVEYKDKPPARRMTVYLPLDVAKKVELIKLTEGRQISEILATAVEEYLEGYEIDLSSL